MHSIFGELSKIKVTPVSSGDKFPPFFPERAADVYCWPFIRRSKQTQTHFRPRLMPRVVYPHLLPPAADAIKFLGAFLTLHSPFRPLSRSRPLYLATLSFKVATFTRTGFIH